MKNSKIVKGKNIILDKAYLQRFYTTEKPDWVRFCERLLDQNFTVLLYLAKNTTSKYLTLIKNYKIMKLRYSNHAPTVESWLKGELKFYIGPNDKGMYSEREVMNAIREYFRG